MTHAADFAKFVLPKYFKHSQLSSFIRSEILFLLFVLCTALLLDCSFITLLFSFLSLSIFCSQLNFYGFHKFAHDSNSSEFRHPNFLKNRYDLLKFIRRKKSTPSTTTTTVAATGAAPSSSLFVLHLLFFSFPFLFFSFSFLSFVSICLFVCVLCFIGCRRGCGSDFD